MLQPADLCPLGLHGLSLWGHRQQRGQLPRKRGVFPWMSGQSESSVEGSVVANRLAAVCSLSTSLFLNFASLPLREWSQDWTPSSQLYHCQHASRAVTLPGGVSHVVLVGMVWWRQRMWEEGDWKACGGSPWRGGCLWESHLEFFIIFKKKKTLAKRWKIMKILQEYIYVYMYVCVCV